MQIQADVIQIQAKTVQFQAKEGHISGNVDIQGDVHYDIRDSLCIYDKRMLSN